MNRPPFLAILAMLTLILAPAAYAHGGGGGGGGGHGGGGHRGGGGYFVIYGGGGAPGIPDSETGDYSAIHKVAVLSVVGSSFPTMIGDQPARSIDVSDWRIDDLVRATLRKYLSPRFDFVDVPLDRNGLLALHKQWYRESDTLTYLKTIANPGVDAYILVRPSDAALPGPPALGLDTSPNFTTVLWTNFEIDIVDAHKLSYVGKAFARLQIQDGQPPAFAAREIAQIPVFLLKTGIFSAPQKDFIHHQTEDLLQNAMVETIRSLKTGVPLPPVGDHSISRPADADIVHGLRTVAIASAIGDSFQFVNPGNMFVKKIDVDVPLAQSGIDNDVVATVRGVLARHYIVKDEPVDSDANARTTVIPGRPIPTFLGLKSTTDVDAYVVVVKATPSQNPQTHGLGLMNITPLMNHVTAVFADYAIVVVDARSLKGVIGSTGELPPQPICTQPQDGFGFFQSPACSVDESMWPASPSSPTPATIAAVTDQVRKILGASIPQTLFKLGLDDPGVVPGAAPVRPAAGAVTIVAHAKAN